MSEPIYSHGLPCKVRTEDGYTFKKQADGSYTDGDLTYSCLAQLEINHNALPVTDYKYEVNQKLWYKGAPVRVTKREPSHCPTDPSYNFENPDGTPHKASPNRESALTNEHCPDKDLLEVGDRIGCYGTISKIQATFDWTLKTRIYLVFNADGQTKWATRNMIHLYNPNTSGSRLHLGSIFWTDNDQWVDNLGVVETYEGPGLKYWIEWDNDGFDNKQYLQVPADQLQEVAHWPTAYKLGDLVTHDGDPRKDIVYRITGYESTRRTRNNGGPDNEILYNILEVNDKRVPLDKITTTVAQGELTEHIPQYKAGDEIKVIGLIYGAGIPEHFCDAYDNEDGIILKKSSNKNSYFVAVPGEDIPKSIIEISHSQMELRE